ncbi:hypothetical protein FACS189441_7280 [Betaproteobacteria bacterium]|nr:hypothetical protein FACS189441_7280 [Betaproteobacteria bacterium]
MAHQPQTLATLCILIAWAAMAEAAEPDAREQTPPAAPKSAAELLAAGKTLQEQAAALREAADRQLEIAEAACAKKFMVNDCRNDARSERLESINEARRLDAEGRELEYRAHLLEREAKEQQRASDQKQRDAELPQRLETRTAEQQTQAAEREKKAAEKEAKARKSAEKAAKRKAEQEKKQAQQAEKAAKKTE